LPARILYELGKFGILLGLLEHFKYPVIIPLELVELHSEGTIRTLLQVELLIHLLSPTHLRFEALPLFDAACYLLFERETLFPVLFNFHSLLLNVILLVLQLLPQGIYLHVHGLQASLIAGPVLSLPLHQVLMINYQLLDLPLQPLVLMLQLHILLGLPSYLLMASLHLLLGLLVASR
jgi:hypothetical protein